MAEKNNPAPPAAMPEAAAGLALGAPGFVPAAQMEEHPGWPMISRLPTDVAVAIPLNRFKVRDLLRLRVGQTIESAWATGQDLPLRVGKVHICWGEFEALDQRMALRLTRLA